MPQFGLLGRKLGHSFSVPIHHALLCPDYELIEIEPDALPDFLRAKAFKGLNVTIPYKQTVMPFCDEISDQAREIGAVNTLVNDNGVIRGFNTDILGFKAMVRAARIDFEAAKVLILGSGGTSKTARAACRSMGAREIVVISREGPVTYADIEKHADADIVVNTTPVGMYPNCPAKLIDLRVFKTLKGVVDVVYNPARTGIILQARELGIAHVSGLKMLVEQAVAAEEYFLSTEIDASLGQKVFEDLACETRNIVLIGMPGSGKSTLGKVLADRSHKTLVDLDTEIERAAGCTIPEIFATEGEAGFRAIETEVAARFGKESRLVIACGGGIVTRPENLPLLRQNGRIYEIVRDLEKLPVDNRPLSKNLDNLRAMARLRAPMYEAFRDVRIDNNGAIEAAQENIWRDFRAHSGD
ncbi:MAG TPA: shikimate kinase [Sutterella sp.]|nr:shikimate kinase [Sutterella sp.]